MAGTLVARALAGFSAAVLPLAQATMADLAGPRDKARGMALVMAAYGTAFVIGPLIAGYSADALTANFMLAAVAAAGCSAVALAVCVVFLSPRGRSAAASACGEEVEPGQRRAVAGSIYFLAPILFVFVFGFVYAGFDTTLALRVTDHFHWGDREVGYLFAIAGAATAISQLALTPWLTRWCGKLYSIAVAGVALMMGLAAMGFAKASWAAVVGIALAAAGAATGVVCLQSVISQISRTRARGAALGVAHSALTLARVLGPLWAGICFGVLGAEWFYVSGGAIMVAAVVLSQILRLSPASEQAVEGAR